MPYKDPEARRRWERRRLADPEFRRGECDRKARYRTTAAGILTRVRENANRRVVG